MTELIGSLASVTDPASCRPSLYRGFLHKLVAEILSIGAGHWLSQYPSKYTSFSLPSRSRSKVQDSQALYTQGTLAEPKENIRGLAVSTPPIPVRGPPNTVCALLVPIVQLY